jgi:hypothetical protein
MRTMLIFRAGSPRRAFWSLLSRQTGKSISRSRRIRLVIESLEDRAMPSAPASLLGFNVTSGNWATAVVNGNTLQTTIGAHWDPYHLTAIVHGDFTGNGETDVAGWSNLGYWLVGVGSGNQFETQQWLAGWGRGITWKAFLVGDFTGDGKDDIAMFANNGTWWVAVSTGTSFQMERWSQPGDWRTGNNWRDWEVGDFNGDGKDDIAGLTNRGGWQVGLSTGTAFQPQTWLPNRTWPSGSKVQAVVAGDFNGDGETDLAAHLTNGAWLVAMSNGTAFDSTVWGTFHTHGTRMLYHAGDFTGDGLADIVAADRHGHTWIFTSTGSSFSTPEKTTVSLHGQRVVRLNTGDFNGDGTDDVALLTAAGNWYVELSGSTNSTPCIMGAFGKGTWGGTFTSNQSEPDLLVNHHRALRPESALSYISPQDLALLRGNPAYFATIFAAYQYRLRAQLGPAFAALDDRGVAFALATIVAYQAAPYRGDFDPQGTFAPPHSHTLAGLLGASKLVCNEYALLAVELYRVVFPAAADPDTSIQMVGFSSGPFGNHAQLFFSSGGVTLLGDPTLGILALATFARLRTGQSVPGRYVRQLAYRVEATPYMQEAMSDFRTNVENALFDGLYPKACLAYVQNVTDV